MTRTQLAVLSDRSRKPARGRPGSGPWPSCRLGSVEKREPAGRMRSAPALRRLSPRRLREVAREGCVREFAAGQHLLHAGEVGDRVFLLLSGAVGIERSDQDLGGEPLRIAERGSGDWVGEIAVVCSRYSSWFILLVISPLPALLVPRA